MVQLASNFINGKPLFCQIHLMPFLPFGEEIPFQYLKCVVSHFIIGNNQAFASDSSVQPVPELHGRNIIYCRRSAYTIRNNLWTAIIGQAKVRIAGSSKNHSAGTDTE